MRRVYLLTMISFLLAPAVHSNPAFSGHWALTIPGGGAGWLGVEALKDDHTASILWGGGSVVPVQEVMLEGNTLVLVRHHQVKTRDGKKAVEKEIIRATINGDDLACTTRRRRQDGSQTDPRAFTGRRIPPHPTAPDISKLRFGPPIPLFNGRNLDGWRLTNENQVNGWTVENGLLSNHPDQTKGQPHKSYGNLRTEQEFEDFRLRLDVRVPPKGNSGIYLRGIYEVQVSDAHGREPNSHAMGGVYSRITPTANPTRPAGEWNSMEILLVDRYVTVKLNGDTIIANQPLLGCTGGALWSDEFRPGPIYLQGDHTGVEYRNIQLYPVQK